MRTFLPAALAALLLSVIGGCVQQHRPSGGARPNLIVVREFAVSPGVITLDPSLGFSLNRGEPGVPAGRRAELIGRAAAFSLADAITQELLQLGYDAVHAEAGDPEPTGNALIVSGAFRSVQEGHRHEGASVEVQAEVDHRPDSGALQQLTTFNMDSRRLPPGGPVPAAGRHGTDVNYQATLVGAAIGRYVADLARVNRWPAAGH